MAEVKTLSRKVKKEKTLRHACWTCGFSVTALCSNLGISRNTAYEAWLQPARFPVAAPKIFSALGINNGKN